MDDPRDVIVGIVLTLLVPSVPASASAPKVGQFVGHSGKEAIGVALGAEGSLAYVCDGKRVGTWFKGRALNGNRLVLRSADSTRLKLTVDGKNLEARLGAEATSLRPATGKAGLYRSDNEQGSKTKLAGWVVQRSGKQVGTLQTGSQLASARSCRRPRVGGSLIAGTVIDPSACDRQLGRRRQRRRSRSGCVASIDGRQSGYVRERPEKAPERAFSFQRRGRDSNPRWTRNAHNGFRA